MKTLWALFTAFLRLCILALALSTAHTPWESAVICGLALIYFAIESFRIYWFRHASTAAIATLQQVFEISRDLGHATPDDEASVKEQVALARTHIDGQAYWAPAITNSLLLLMALGALVVAAWR